MRLCLQPSYWRITRGSPPARKNVKQTEILILESKAGDTSAEMLTHKLIGVRSPSNYRHLNREPPSDSLMCCLLGGLLVGLLVLAGAHLVAMFVPQVTAHLQGTPGDKSILWATQAHIIVLSHMVV